MGGCASTLCFPPLGRSGRVFAGCRIMIFRLLHCATRSLVLCAAASLWALSARAQSAARTSSLRAAPGAGRTAASAALAEPRLKVAGGLRATVYATVPGARFMTVGPDGAVYVSAPGTNQIVRLTDANGDGVADSPTVAVDGLNRPQGMAFHNGWLYIANTDGVVRVRLDQAGKGTAKAERVNRYSSGGGHWTRTLIFGPDNRMYVSIGSHCNLCIESDSDRAAVMRYNESGTSGHVFARGLRNAVGLAFDPGTGVLWATQNERDNLQPDHEDLPPDEINLLRDGGDYGWPYCYGNRTPNPEYHDAARCASTIPPALDIQAHSAPLGIVFLRNATQLPAAYRGDALVALHGSWNRKVPTEARVVRIHIRDNKPVSYDDFITGWQDAKGSRWGRPVDMVVMRDGAVLVSDDASGEIVRIAKQ